MANEQVNVSTLIVIVVLSGLFVRYLFFSKPSGGGGAGTVAPGFQRGAAAQRDGPAAARAREVAAERIMQMFPHVDRRTVLWDLQRTGGNLTATTERILSGSIETPPMTFQPPPPPPGMGGTSTTHVQGKSAPVPSQPDLITRYKLHDKIKSGSTESETAETTSASPTPGKKAWSANKDERQSLLQRRRDEMIIEARRKMEAKIAAEKAAAAGKAS